MRQLTTDEICQSCNGVGESGSYYRLTCEKCGGTGRKLTGLGEEVWELTQNAIQAAKQRDWMNECEP